MLVRGEAIDVLVSMLSHQQVLCIQFGQVWFCANFCWPNDDVTQWCSDVMWHWNWPVTRQLFNSLYSKALHYRPLIWGMLRWPVDSPHKGPAGNVESVPMSSTDQAVMFANARWLPCSYRSTWCLRLRMIWLCRVGWFPDRKGPNIRGCGMGITRGRSWHGSNSVRHWNLKVITRLIPGLCPANERRRYFVTPSLIGWVQA